MGRKKEISDQQKEYNDHVIDLAKSVIDEMKNHDQGWWNSAFDSATHEYTDQDSWVIDPERAILVLQYSRNPCAGIVNGTGPIHSKDLDHDPTKDFPFNQFAKSALEQDVSDKAASMLAEEGIDINKDKYCTMQDDENDEDEEGGY